MSTTQEIRTAFLGFFAKNAHEVVASSPLVPRNDPSLMFTNAGMVQFKNVFTGAETRPYVRAATSQKCVRAGGKHNDLDNVGYTARHHTFFEMLGNFSFGDYFKEGAIKFAWDLMTKDYALDKKRLMVTVHSSDEEAAALWKKIAGFSDDKIVRIPTSDNFWSMGETGPCGPCTEIFWDHGDKIPGGPPGSADADGDRFVEIWNNVFMQFEQVDANTRVNLPKPSVDTGMGLERIAAVLQGVTDNYDIDLFQALISAIAQAGGTDPKGPHKASHRVIADHLRASGFLIADGVLPSNEGRGYVLRRIMRRAMRHATMMGVQDTLLYKLVPALIAQMGGQYPELERAQALITETLSLEETRFKSLLDRGLKLLDEEIPNIQDGKLSGDVAFKLYDTYGFPLDLTQDALRARNIGVDTVAFDAAMQKQRAEARKAWSGSGDAATEKLWFELRDKVGATDFLGYATETAEGRITAIAVNGASVEEAKAGQEVMILANQSPFYGESGGQIGDTGVIEVMGGKASIQITDTHKKLDALHVHHGKVVAGTVKVGDEARFLVDGPHRSAVRGHHSATHLLHSALRRTLGTHVTQKGSLVSGERLRFDVSHPKPLSADEIRIVENLVNAEVRNNEVVTTRLMDPESAQKAGAMALFGEKYGDEVRVVAMGTPGDSNINFSVELCGGTHVRRTGDIGLFKIVGESAVAAGVRRIEAVTGAAAEAWVAEEDRILKEAANVLRVAPAELPGRIAGLVEERRKLEREIADLRKKLATGGGGAANGAAADKKNIGSVAFMGRVLADVPGKDLKGIADEMKKQVGSGVIALISTMDGKANVVVAVTDDLTAKLSAVDLVRAGAAAVGGKGGGGRPDMAQAGGPDGGNAANALAAIEQELAKIAN